jgi:pimeloyl-ACP methyl ester carboxylesterase
MADLRAAADHLRSPGGPPVTIVGWSEGAGLGVLATAPQESKSVFRGVVAIGLPETGILGWRWQDTVTWVTKKIPDEPRFQTKPYLRSVSPLPFVMIQSSQDEWTPVWAARALFDAAADPKRLFLVDSKNHKFEGNRDEFFRRLREALEWMNP